MKKIYLLAILSFVFSNLTFGQRTIDWSISQVLEPTEMNSNEQTGTVINTLLVLKNNGTSTAKTGDTLVYQIVLTDPSNNPIIAYPSATSLALKPLSRDVASGDTIHLRLNLSAQIFARNSFNVTFLAVCYVWNRGATDPITLETDIVNNKTSKSIIWWNPYKNGVGIQNLASGKMLNVYPNPANNEVSINWPISSTGSAATITVTDLQGRVVMSTEMNNFTGSETLDIAALKAGLYMVEVSTADVKMSEKLQVIR